MDYRRAYAWHITACKKKRRKKRKRLEKHHVLPKCLGGKSGSKVYMSRMEHTYAHLLLPLALLDEGKEEDAKRLANSRQYLPGYFTLLSRRAMRLTKVHVWMPDETPAVMTLKSAAKMYCKRAHKDWTRDDEVGEMAFNILGRIATGKPYFAKRLALAV